jgi:hypothetical protein
VVAVCAAHRIPLTPRGAGTGLEGGAIPYLGGVVLDLMNMKSVEILRDDMQVTETYDLLFAQYKRPFINYLVQTMIAPLFYFILLATIFVYQVFSHSCNIILVCGFIRLSSAPESRNSSLVKFWSELCTEIIY